MTPKDHISASTGIPSMSVPLLHGGIPEPDPQNHGEMIANPSMIPHPIKGPERLEAAVRLIGFKEEFRIVNDRLQAVGGECPNARQEGFRDKEMVDQLPLPLVAYGSLHPVVMRDQPDHPEADDGAASRKASRLPLPGTSLKSPVQMMLARSLKAATESIRRLSVAPAAFR